MSGSVISWIAPAPDHVAALAAEHVGGEGIVLLPDTITESQGTQVAGFRSDAQDLRVSALEAGLPVVVAVPDGATPGAYVEHSADWVLPLIVMSGAIPIATNLISNLIQRKIDQWRASGQTRNPTLRYREVIRQRDGTTQLREIEGPAEAVADWLRDERAHELPPGDEPG
jgi:hypothetical protein